MTKWKEKLAYFFPLTFITHYQTTPTDRLYNTVKLSKTKFIHVSVWWDFINWLNISHRLEEKISTLPHQMECLLEMMKAA